MGFRLAVSAAALAALAWLAPAAAAERVGFLSAVEDLPLAPGLVEQPAAGVVFDTPDGRIVEAHALGETSAEAVRAFYADALPELGWARRGALEFGREGEVLRIELLAGGDGLSVKYSLQPER